MIHDRTYRPVRRVPASLLRGADGSMRQAPRRSAGHAATHTVQPLKGLPGTRATDVSYRALAPGGAGFCYRICTGTSESRLTAHYSLLTANSTYTFSAKEKDPETGLSYFGSRYYSSDLSVWLSVDPMAGKYPHQSNFVYCSNNPIKVVDPNGEDEWEVNQSGYIRHIRNDKPNRLYAVYGYGKERWGKRKSDVEPLNVDESIMETMDNRGKYTTFSAQNNRAKMDELFNFFADNTDVEWTQLGIHDKCENKYDFLSTSHVNIHSDLPLTYKAMVHANAKNGTLDTFKHSHPNNYTGFIIYYQIIYPYTCHIPSGDDRKTKNEILDEYRLDKPKPQFFLRNGGHNYVY